MRLAAAFQDVDAFARGVSWDAIKVSGALLELGEILDGLERALRPEEALHVHAAEGRRVDAVPVLVRTNIADGMRGGIGMSVGMAIETTYSEMSLQAAAVFSGVELLLGKRGDQQAQSFEL